MWHMSDFSHRKLHFYIFVTPPPAESLQSLAAEEDPELEASLVQRTRRLLALPVCSREPVRLVETVCLHLL